MNKQCISADIPAISSTDPADRLASLFDSNYDRLYRLARRLAPSADDALDLVQETFLKAARHPKTIPAGASNEEAWLVRVLINIRRDQWRKMSVRARHLRAVSYGSPSESSRSPEAGLIARTAIWQALDVLPPRRRAIIVMHELEELSVSKIASLLGITAVTVRWHLSRGRRDLARALKPCEGVIHE